MANIVYRSASTPGINENTLNKGSPLTNTEIDGNFKGVQEELDTKAPLASPTLTGTPLAPTAAAGTNTTQIATTAHVFAERSNTATLTNKTLTNPTINASGGVLVLPATEVPAQTTEGSVVWDSNDDLLTVGTGTTRKTIVDTDSTQGLTGKTYNKVTITTPTNGATVTIADGKTFTLNNTLTFSGTDASSVAFGAGGTVAYTANKLSVFAATTSAELAGVISDETGTGALVFATSPTLSQATINTDVKVPIVYGSTSASGTLTLASTTNATKGTVFLGGSGDVVRLNTTTNGVLTAGSSNGTFTVDTGTYYKAGGTDVAIADGGTGLSTAPTNGQILIGSGSSYVLGSIASGTGITVTNAAGSITVANAGVTSLTGTANRVSVSGSTGTVTISGPQDLHSAATPSFTQVSLSSAPTATGHAATKSYVDGAIKDGTLTVNTSGTGISGSGTFTANQSTNNTITISSNATSANTASTIVARDANGDFNARIVTAALTGNASTATTLATARNINGVSFNGGSDITVTANTANSITFNSSGTGVASGSTFNGGSAITISHNTIGAYSATNPSGFTSNVGTVTSVGGTGTVSGLTLSGTVTTSGNLSLGGTLAVTPSNFASQTANTFLAAPNGVAGAPTFRGIVAADIPTLNQNTTGTASNVTGTVAVGNGGTGSTTAQGAINTLAGATTSGSYLRGNGTNVVMSAIQATDVPTLNQNTTGTAANVTGVVAVGNGGTGASDAGTARSNLGAAAAGQTMHIGTTAVAINRGSGALSLNGVNIDGSAGSVAWTNVTGRPSNVSAFTNDAAYITSSASITGSAATFTSTTQNSQFNSIGIGTAASATTGEIRATNNVTAYYSSDRKFKENILDVQNAVDIVSAIGAKTFSWTDSYIEDHGGEDGYFVTKNDFGVIAQDVQQVFPLAVRTREDGSLAVNYDKLAVLAFAAIKEQQAQIDELRKLILSR